MSIENLNVWQAGRPAGELRRNDGALSFAYFEQTTQPISRSLPLLPRLNTGEPVLNFFSSLLPPLPARVQCATALKCAPDDIFTLLAHMGADAAGGLAILPKDKVPGPGTQAVIEPHELKELLGQLTLLPMLAGTARISQTLCGARPKLGIMKNADGTLALPLDGARSTHVIKPDLAPWQGAALCEVLCQKLARAVGVPASAAEFILLDDVPCSLIERYDVSDSQPVAAETFAQALGKGNLPRESLGGPTLADCFALIETFANDVRAEQQVLMDYVLFNALIGNANADGSLFVTINDAGGTRLAPLHGALCAAAFPHLQQRLALRLGHAGELGDLRAEDLHQMLTATQLEPLDLITRGSEMASNIRLIARELLSVHADLPGVRPVSEALLATIEHNSMLLMQTLRQLKARGTA